MLQHKSGDRSRRMNIVYYMNPEYICGDRGSPKTSSRKLSIARMRIPDIAVRRENRRQRNQETLFSSPVSSRKANQETLFPGHVFLR